MYTPAVVKTNSNESLLRFNTVSDQESFREGLLHNHSPPLSVLHAMKERCVSVLTRLSRWSPVLGEREKEAVHKERLAVAEMSVSINRFLWSLEQQICEMDEHGSEGWSVASSIKAIRDVPMQESSRLSFLHQITSKFIQVRNEA